jgi:hypothetical protein
VAKQVVEGTIFQIDDNDVLDLVDIRRGGRRNRGRVIGGVVAASERYKQNRCSKDTANSHGNWSQTFAFHYSHLIFFE